ncbi:hypothetical protein C1645_749988 [Glomus cerebriforme]|uniref:Methyltransferase type 11 domain-containing protein n=1 Tax=Glomus cerebriforme TaxID=658196 RepID=A0A397TTP3_9GLOM|nr:hypothetical protein C1645_749988 [Glomus cerebriforme]
MGNKFSKKRPFFIRRRRDDSDISNTEITEIDYVDTIWDANFSWLEGRRVSDEFYLIERYCAEADRLAYWMHIIFKYILRGNSRIPLNSNMKKCLHIGTGHYIWLIEMAEDHDGIQFDGFDLTFSSESEELTTPLPQNARFVRGSIFEGGLPYPDNYFDYVNVRSLLTWLPDDKISYVIDEVRRVTKRGCFVEILELDLFIKNGTPYYEDNLGKIWKDICSFKGYDPSRIINMDKFFDSSHFASVNLSKLSIPIGKYGGKVGELHAEQFVNGTNAVAAIIKDKLNMSYEEIQIYLQDIVKELNLNQAYSNSYLICAQKN